jgi:NADPH:quinone reductase
MKAVWLKEFGRPEVLVAADAPDPVPGPGQALIEVAFANITFVETMFRASGFGPFETELPMIPGNGVEVAVDYRESGWAQRVREAIGAVEVVFDGVGGDVGESAFGLLDRGGRMVRFGMASGEWARISDEAAAGRGVELIGLSRLAPEETRALTEDALAEAAAGRLRPVIGQRFTLDRAADAHAAIESRATVGKTLLVT